MNKNALIIAHPGHELLIYKWLKNNPCRVYIFSDGSGSANEARIHKSIELLNNIGSVKSDSIESIPDKALYQKVLNKESDFFINIAERIYSELILTNVDIIIGDRMEGFNPIHDICRMLINSVAARLDKKNLKNYSFSLENLSSESEAFESIILSDEEFEEKLNAANNYHELDSESVRLRSKFQDEVFKTEKLLLEKPENLDESSYVNPYYESFGKRQIEKGVYKDLITYKDHLFPIYTALKDWSKRK